MLLVAVNRPPGKIIEGARVAPDLFCFTDATSKAGGAGDFTGVRFAWPNATHDVMIAIRAAAVIAPTPESDQVTAVETPSSRAIRPASEPSLAANTGFRCAGRHDSSSVSACT